jgi:predicted CxxxxCH...CXXCH cytochrome family protein
VRSAPVSITAIVTAEAARRTDAGTVSACAAAYCHSYGKPRAVEANSAGSEAEMRAWARST